MWCIILTGLLVRSGNGALVIGAAAAGGGAGVLCSTVATAGVAVVLCASVLAVGLVSTVFFAGKTILMTEKDAVKCEQFASGNAQYDIWVLPVSANIDHELNALVLRKLLTISKGK